ncbi:MAG TPA: glycoside hydrolase family 15 protein [Blastocatellia bacterium]|nr:glycoside hydrolase family 15 protein [Blastocatellia bacterium]
MPYQPIENYGLIGNMRTAALVSLDGSIDWFCYPYFDSPSVFGAILDDKRGGRFQLCAVGDGLKRKQLYWPSTNILVTRYLLADGIAEVEDFMPVGVEADSPACCALYRRVRSVKGAVRFSVVCQPAFDYGRQHHQTTLPGYGAIFDSPDLKLALCTTVPLRMDEQGTVSGHFVLEEGSSQVFILRRAGDGDRIEPPPSEDEAERVFQSTVKFWRKWLATCTYHGRWRERVQRSALTLKLLTFEPTGAIIAAPTTSLPEVISGERNWDYRYTWLRDAAFTVYAFLRIGFKAEAAGFIKWMHNYMATDAHTGKPLPTVFTIHGASIPAEQTLTHWEGYHQSGPVRIGNGAANQFQSDIYGELMDSAYLANKYVAPTSYDAWERMRARLNWICQNWQRPDAGIWEMRGRKEHFVYSKVMNWVALDRGIRLADKRSFPSERDKWIQERNRIYEEVLSEGWNEQRQAFTQFYGSGHLDAASLIMPLAFFMSPSDPRMLATIDAILQSPRDAGLVTDGLVYRYPPGADGFEGEEGTFNMCSFWLVEALTRAGLVLPEKLDQARLVFERMLGYANHLGLYAEQTGPQGEALGNFPQALTHLALISAAYNLDRVLDGR